MTAFYTVALPGSAPEVSRPDVDKLVSGDPVHSHWPLEAADGLYCGLWQSTPGAWRVAYSEWEFVHIREGFSRLKGDDGSILDLREGRSAVIQPGFTGVWEVVKTTVKEYVIRD